MPARPRGGGGGWPPTGPADLVGERGAVAHGGGSSESRRHRRPLTHPSPRLGLRLVRPRDPIPVTSCGRTRRTCPRSRLMVIEVMHRGGYLGPSLATAEDAPGDSVAPPPAAITSPVAVHLFSAATLDGRVRLLVGHHRHVPSSGEPAATQYRSPNAAVVPMINPATSITAPTAIINTPARFTISSPLHRNGARAATWPGRCL